MRTSASCSIGFARSVSLPSIFATMAASAKRGEMDFAISSAEVPRGTCFTLPSGSLTLIIAAEAASWTCTSDIESYRLSIQIIEFSDATRRGSNKGVALACSACPAGCSTGDHPHDYRPAGLGRTTSGAIHASADALSAGPETPVVLRPTLESWLWERVSWPLRAFH